MRMIAKEQVLIASLHPPSNLHRQTQQYLLSRSSSTLHHPPSVSSTCTSRVSRRRASSIRIRVRLVRNCHRRMSTTRPMPKIHRIEARNLSSYGLTLPFPRQRRQPMEARGHMKQLGIATVVVVTGVKPMVQRRLCSAITLAI